MRFVTMAQVGVMLQSVRKILSFKADKDEIPVIPDGVEFATEIGLVSPIAAHDNSIYTDGNESVYIFE